jgi:gliding motility-associated-like protein
VRYRNKALDRTNTNRTIQFSVSDGTNVSPTASLTLEVPNIAPTITLSKMVNAYNGTSTVVDDALLIADSDDANLVGASVAITDFLLANEDQLTFATQNGISGNYNVTTGILQLSGTSSLLNYQNALRSVAYQNTSANRTPGTKKISVQINDGQALSTVSSLDLLVSNTAPSISSNLAATFYLGDNLTINNSIVIMDNDNATLQSAVVTISSGYLSNEDQLAFTNQNGITGSFVTSTGTLQLTGASSQANYQTALRSIQFRNTSSVPNATPRVITFSVNDGNATSNLLATRIDMNQPPVVNAPPQTTEAGGNVSFSMSSILSDPDNNLDPSTLSIVSLAGAEVSIVGDQIIIDYSAVPDFKGTDALTITICDIGGQCKSQEVSITLEADVIVYNGVSPNGDQANDYFKIRFLPAGSKVLIYNRWGDLVFEMLDYKNDQPGHRFEGVNMNGNELTSGTYFYKIEIPNQKELTGYLVLKR